MPSAALPSRSSPAGQGAEGIRIALAPFMRGFIAGLAAQGNTVIIPADTNDRRGFMAVVRLLDGMVEQAVEEGRQETASCLVHIANRLRPGNMGGFEGFEAALCTEHVLARRVGDDYKAIAFPLPRDYAKSLVDGMDTEHRKVVEECVDAFLRARSPFWPS